MIHNFPAETQSLFDRWLPRSSFRVWSASHGKLAGWLGSEAGVERPFWWGRAGISEDWGLTDAI